MSEAARRQTDVHAGVPEATLVVCGIHARPDVTGALYLPDAQTVVVSDLHFEKGSSFAPKGQYLPPYDTRATLTMLEKACARYNPYRVIALGDSFHDQSARERLDDADLARIRTLTSSVVWTWITGNHDPSPPADIGGNTAHELDIGPLTFRHEPRPAPQTGEISGHLHPAAAVVVRGRRLRRRCFVSDGTRLIMPSFGAFTGGLNVTSAPFEDLFDRTSFTAWMIGRDEVYPVAGRRLRRDSI